MRHIASCLLNAEEPGDGRIPALHCKESGQGRFVSGSEPLQRVTQANVETRVRPCCSYCLRNMPSWWVKSILQSKLEPSTPIVGNILVVRRASSRLLFVTFVAPSIPHHRHGSSFGFAETSHSRGPGQCCPAMCTPGPRDSPDFAARSAFSPWEDLATLKRAARKM